MAFRISRSTPSSMNIAIRVHFSRSQVIIYNFNYTIFSNIPWNIPIQQPTAAQYAAFCGAIGGPSASADPYIIDICDYFPSITNGNVQLIMQAISAYYTARRISTLSARKFKMRRCVIKLMSHCLLCHFNRTVRGYSIESGILCHSVR
jgi:hypothetical protein